MAVSLMSKMQIPNKDRMKAKVLPLGHYLE